MKGSPGQGWPCQEVCVGLSRESATTCAWWGFSSCRQLAHFREFDLFFAPSHIFQPFLRISGVCVTLQEEHPAQFWLQLLTATLGVSARCSWWQIKRIWRKGEREERGEVRSQKGCWRVQRSGIKSTPVGGCCCTDPLPKTSFPFYLFLFIHLPGLRGSESGSSIFQHSPQTAGLEGTSLLQTLKYHLWKICLSCNYKNLCDVQDDTGFGSLVTEMLSSAEHLGMEIFLEWFCKQNKNPEQ